VNREAQITPSTWSLISSRLALVIAVFIVGHAVGAWVAEKLSISNNCNHYNNNPQQLQRLVARLGGAAISLHIFSYGAGMNSVFGLVVVRFFSAVVVSVLRAITDPSSVPEDISTNDDTVRGVSPSTVTPGRQIKLQQQQEQHQLTPDPRSDIASGTAKIYLTGFALSTLFGGLYFQAASMDKIFQALTGSHPFTWSPLFFVAMMALGETILRGAFALTAQPEHLDRSSGTTVRNVKKLVRRIVGGVPQRVSFIKGDVRGQVDPESLRLVGSTDPLRPRTLSAASAVTEMDEFFDCQSELSDPMPAPKPPIRDDEYDDDDVAIYVDGKCCYADGTAAFVPQGDSPSVIPENYIEDNGGNRNKAMRLWQETQSWRREQNVWRIHSMPNKYYDDIKQGYPHFAHGYSRNGYPVMYEQPGKMKLKELFSGECSIDDMVHHYIFVQEFLSNCLCSSPLLRSVAAKATEPYNSSSYGIIVVMDIKGAGVSMLSSDILRYLKRVGDINAAHYPLSIKRVCVVNAPFWASGVFSTIKKVLPDSVVADLISEKDCTESLQKHIDLDQIPPDYGGTSPYRLGGHPYEKQLADLVAKAASRSRDIEANNPALVVSSTPSNLECTGDISSARGENAAVTQPETSSRSLDNPMDPENKMRQRTAGSSASTLPCSEKPVMPATAQGKVGVDSLAFVSFFCAFWSGAQGGIEIAIPLWLSSPISYGGLGYSPSMSGITIFCVAIVLFSILTTRASRIISHMPRDNPLRALRFGIGAESAILFLLAIVPINLS